MLRLLADENFSGYVVCGLLRRRSTLSLVRVQDVGLAEADDPTILAWAAANDYILLTYDRVIVPEFPFQRIAARQPMSRVFVLNARLALREAIDELLLLDECSEQSEWQNLVVYLPL